MVHRPAALVSRRTFRLAREIHDSSLALTASVEAREHRGDARHRAREAGAIGKVQFADDREIFVRRFRPRTDR